MSCWPIGQRLTEQLAVPAVPRAQEGREGRIDPGFRPLWIFPTNGCCIFLVWKFGAGQMCQQWKVAFDNNSFVCFHMHLYKHACTRPSIHPYVRTYGRNVSLIAFPDAPEAICRQFLVPEHRRWVQLVMDEGWICDRRLLFIDRAAVHN